MSPEEHPAAAPPNPAGAEGGGPSWPALHCSQSSVNTGRALQSGSVKSELRRLRGRGRAAGSHALRAPGLLHSPGLPLLPKPQLPPSPGPPRFPEPGHWPRPLPLPVPERGVPALRAALGLSALRHLAERVCAKGGPCHPGGRDLCPTTGEASGDGRPSAGRTRGRGGVPPACAWAPLPGAWLRVVGALSPAGEVARMSEADLASHLQAPQGTGRGPQPSGTGRAVSHGGGKAGVPAMRGMKRVKGLAKCGCRAPLCPRKAGHHRGSPQFRKHS